MEDNNRSTALDKVSKNVDNNNGEITLNPPQDFEVALARKIQSMSSNLLNIFLKLDVDRDGYVTRSDLKIALHNVFGIDLIRSQMDGLFARFAYFEKDHRDAIPEEISSSHNNNHHHGIKYTEFVAYIRHTAQSPNNTSASAYGASLQVGHNDQSGHDTNAMYSKLPSSDVITSDLRQALGRLLNQKTGEDMKNTHLFLSMDTHRNGRISPQEFQEWFCKVGLTLTEDQVRSILGEHYKPQIDMKEFAEVIHQLKNYNSVDIGQDSHDDAELLQTQNLTDTAHQSLVNSIHQCVDDAKTDTSIVKIVAEQLYKEKTRLFDAFHKWDLDGSGKLDVGEFHQALNSFGLDISQQRAQSLVKKFDEDGDGKLNQTEFMRFISFSLEDDVSSEQTHEPNNSEKQKAESDSSTSNLRESIKKSVKGHEDENKYTCIVNQLDHDDLDTIITFRKALISERILVSRAFRNFDKDGSGQLHFQELKAAFIQMKVRVSDEHLKHILKRFDSDGSGKLAFHQFLKLMSSNLEG